MDLVVNDNIIIELKAVSHIETGHEDETTLRMLLGENLEILQVFGLNFF